MIALSGLEIRVGSKVLVHDVALRVEPGEVVGLVGASGSGKSLTTKALLGMVDLSPGVVAADLAVDVDGVVHRPYDACLGGDRRARDKAFAPLRGAVIGTVPQDCRAALDPLLRVGPQVALCARLRGIDEDPLPWLSRAGFPEPERVAALYPHELSGGMAQRAVIAQALARGSRFLLADEPTTALDPTVQQEILLEFRECAAEGLGVLLITHDLRILPGLASRVVLMHDGTVAETCTAEALVHGGVASEPGRALLEATRRVAGGRLG